MTDSNEAELRELLAQMPAITEQLDAEAITGDLEYLELKDWSDRTIAAANHIGRDDIAAKVRSIMANLDAAMERARRATETRRSAHTEAEEVLRRFED